MNWVYVILQILEGLGTHVWIVMVSSNALRICNISI